MFLHQSATKLVHFSRKSVQKITVMADYYHRSVKIADSLLQHIFGTHVKMIRRFVENQEIHRLQQQFYHGKPAALPKKQFRSLLNGVLVQDRDLKVETPEELKTVTTKAPTAQEIEDMLFANKIVKNSKSNAIVLAKGKQLLASGVGQTSRVDALKQAIEKAKNFGFDLNGAVMASDAFFPFPDCVEIAGNEGVTAVIQPGGSIKDELSFEYCNEHGIAMVTTGFRHFKH